ncbi:NUDIX domain-containing protein [Halococcus agarilyticus]|uniref:NUDIX domain-containing protein n=1 Tax=Halococcus agarilyticus TaxID=1232219 RepID=UPI000A7066EC|nr:NUDIX domain-containing protein [Halococcus agarilyticus]
MTIVRDAEFLPVRRAVAPDAGSWTVPGGHLEFDEAPREGAVRELEEEAGIVATPDDPVLSAGGNNGQSIHPATEPDTAQYPEGSDAG